EQPTARRREEARRQGRYPVSRDLPGALVLLGGLGVFAMAGGNVLRETVAQLERGLVTLPSRDLTLDGALIWCREAGVAAIHIGWPFLVVPVMIAVAVALGQSRFALSLSAVKPQWSRIDPAQGLRRLLSGASAVEALKALVKLAAVIVVAYVTVRGD